MSQFRWLRMIGVFMVLAAFGRMSASAQQVKTVFVIAMENHNWTQPPSVTSPQQISGNSAAPFINSLVNGTATAVINGIPVNISAQVSYATAYHNSGVGVHPSEPNYLWAEADTNFGRVER